MTLFSTCSGTMPLGPAARAIAGRRDDGTSSPSGGSCGRRIESAALLTTKWKARPSASMPFVPNQPANARPSRSVPVDASFTESDVSALRCPATYAAIVGNESRSATISPPRASGGRRTVGAYRPASCSPSCSGVKSPRRFSTIAVRPTWSPVIVNGSVSVVAAAGRRMPRSDGVVAGCSRRPSSAGDCDEKSLRQPSIDASERGGECEQREVAAVVSGHVARLAHDLSCAGDFGIPACWIVTSLPRSSLRTYGAGTAYRACSRSPCDERVAIGDREDRDPDAEHEEDDGERHFARRARKREERDANRRRCAASRELEQTQGRRQQPRGRDCEHEQHEAGQQEEKDAGAAARLQRGRVRLPSCEREQDRGERAERRDVRDGDAQAAERHGIDAERREHGRGGDGGEQEPDPERAGGEDRVRDDEAARASRGGARAMHRLRCPPTQPARLATTVSTRTSVAATRKICERLAPDHVSRRRTSR